MALCLRAERPGHRAERRRNRVLQLVPSTWQANPPSEFASAVDLLDVPDGLLEALTDEFPDLEEPEGPAAPAAPEAIPAAPAPRLCRLAVLLLCKVSNGSNQRA